MAKSKKEFNVDFINKFIDELNKKFITKQEFMKNSNMTEVQMQDLLSTIRETHTTKIPMSSKLYISREVLKSKKFKPMDTEFIDKFNTEFKSKFIPRSIMYKPFIDNAIKNGWVQYVKINRAYYIWCYSMPEYDANDITKFKKEIGPYVGSYYTFNL